MFMTKPLGSALEKRNCRNLKQGYMNLICLRFALKWGLVASLFLLVLCSCGKPTSSSPCASAEYEECLKRTENTWAAGMTCNFAYDENECDDK